MGFFLHFLILSPFLHLTSRRWYMNKSLAKSMFTSLFRSVYIYRKQRNVKQDQLLLFLFLSVFSWHERSIVAEALSEAWSLCTFHKVLSFLFSPFYWTTPTLVSHQCILCYFSSQRRFLTSTRDTRLGLQRKQSIESTRTLLLTRLSMTTLLWYHWLGLCITVTFFV